MARTTGGRMNPNNNEFDSYTRKLELKNEELKESLEHMTAAYADLRVERDRLSKFLHPNTINDFITATED